MFSFLSPKRMADTQQQPVDKIYAFWRRLKEEEAEAGAHDDGDGDDGALASQREVLESTLVPFLREELNRIDDEIDKDDGHDHGEDEGEEKKSGEHAPQPVTVILECFRHFVAAPRNGREDKAFFVTSGAFEETRHILKLSLLRLATPSGETVLALEILAHLTTHASDALKNDHILSSVPLIHQLMEGSLLTTDDCGEGDGGGAVSSADSSGPSPPPLAERRALIQVYGCQIIRHLSNPLLQELVVAGSVEVLARAMYTCVDEPLVHEHGNAALYNLLPVCPTTYLLGRNPHDALVQQEQQDDQDLSLIPLPLPSIVVRGMQAHPRDWRVQQYGLLVLKRICQRDVEQFEWMASSEGGLSVVLSVLSDLTSGPSSAGANEPSSSSSPPLGHGDEDEATVRECLVQLSSQFLKDLSRPSNYSQHTSSNSNDDEEYNNNNNNQLHTISQSTNHHHYQMDMVRIIAIKGALQAMVQVLHRYSNNPNICDPALSCLRNLLVHPETQQQALDPIYPSEGSADNTLSTIPTIHQCMAAQPQDAAIQAYGCDILGRLAQSQAEARRQIVLAGTERGGGSTALATTPSSTLLGTILRAMVTHRSHAGVQDRAIFALVALMKGHAGDASSSSSIHNAITTATIMGQLEPAFEALQPKWGEHDVFIEDDLQSFFKASKVPHRGAARVMELSELVRTHYVQISEGTHGGGSATPGYDAKKAAASQTPDKSPRSILSFSFASLSSTSSHSPTSGVSSAANNDYSEEHKQQQHGQGQGGGDGTAATSFFSPGGWKKKLTFSSGQ
jgi:hypothetical protein